MKKFFIAIIFIFAALPAFSKVEGGVSQSYFYDLENTLMAEVETPKLTHINKILENDFLFAGNYTPQAMLSRRDLLKSIAPKKPVIIYQQYVPSMYSISFKTAKAVAVKNY